MGTSALGGFVEGLQGGITHRRQTLRNKKIDRALDQQNKLGAMAIQGQQDDINAVRAAKGLAPRDFTQFEADQDPYGFKLSDFFKPRKLWQNFKDNAGFGQSMDNPASPVQANEAAIEDITFDSVGSSVGMQGNTDNMNLMAARDGGAIKKYNRGGAVRSDYVRASERIAGGRAGATAAEVKAGTNRVPKPAGRLRAAGRAAARGAVPVMYGATAVDTATTPTEDYRTRGVDKIPGMRWTQYDEDDSNLQMLGKDLAVRGVGALTDLGEMFTFGAAGEERFDDQNPEVRAAIQRSDVGKSARRGDKAIAAQSTPEPTPAAAPAAPAADPVAQRTAAGPNALADAPITMPDEMPTMNTEEWVAYRAASVENMLMRGMTLPEAHEAITTMQQKGFLNYGTQALQMLAAGDPARAAMALKAAYQYFPNGADVSFGITKDANGQPALVAMGRDEKTGESTGAPVVITGERLAVMMENMTDPSAFRTWTKDWREFEQDLREYYEVEKQQAESENIYRDRMGRAAIGRAQADLVGAQRGGGLKQSDLDRAYAAMEKRLADRGLLEGMPAEDIDFLTTVSGIAYEADPGNYLATVGNIISLYEQGGVEAVDQWMRSGE